MLDTSDAGRHDRHLTDFQLKRIICAQQWPYDSPITGYLFFDQPQVFQALKVSAISPAILNFPFFTKNQRPPSVCLDIPSPKNDLSI
ncbi:hypothetical protein Pfra02_00600 [Pseudomonas fragi]|nr:hypothetical protein Pfra02_00600 [Pseudomonas fragi]